MRSKREQAGTVPYFSSTDYTFPFGKGNLPKTLSHFVMNNGRTKAAIVRRKALLSSPVVKVQDKLVPLGEYSYGIDLKGVEFINLLAEKSWRGPPPKRPRRILKLVSHWLQR